MKKFLLFLLILPILIVDALPLSAQSLDDGWSDQFGFPTLPSSVIGITADHLGNIYANVHTLFPTEISRIYQWDGADWKILDVPMDTVVINGISMTISYDGIMLRRGEILAIGERVYKAREHRIVRWNRSEWEIISDPLIFSEDEGGISPPFKGSAENYYVNFSKKNGADYLSGVAQWNGTAWETVTSKPQSEGWFGLLDAGADGSLFISFVHTAEESFDSIFWWNGQRWNAIKDASSDLELRSFTIFGGHLYGIRDFSIETVQARRRIGAQIFELTNNGWEPFSDRLETDSAVLGNVNPFVFDKEGIPSITTSEGVFQWKERRWQPLSTTFIPRNLLVTENNELIGHNGDFVNALPLKGTGIARYDGMLNRWDLLYADDKENLGLSSEPSSIVVDNALYVAAGFSIAANGDSPVRGDILRLQNGGWESITGLNRPVPYSNMSSVSQIIPHPSGGLYVSGLFDSANGQYAKNIAHWNGATWHPLGDTALFNFRVHSMALQKDTLYVIGNREDMGPNGPRIKTLLAKWNGAHWIIIEDNLTINSGKLLVDGDALYIGGGFDKIASVRPREIARLQNGVWDDMKGGAKLGATNFYGRASVRTLYKHNSNVYAAGYFDTMGITPAWSIARWDGSDWFALDSGLTKDLISEFSSNSVPAVNGIAQTGDYLIVTGSFNAAGSRTIGSPRRVELGCGIAFWDMKSETWNSLGSGLCSPLNPHAAGTALAVHGDTVWVSGSFTHAGGIPSSSIARYVIPPAKISTPEVPAIIDFGTVSPGQSLTQILAVTNPTTSTRTLRGEIKEMSNPFGITFDGTFQGSSGQVISLPITFFPTEVGEFLDTITISHNADNGEDVHVIVKGRSIALGVAEDEKQTGSLFLSSYPNPFSRETTISYRLPVRGLTRLAIYSIEGQEIATLFNEERSAGEYTFRWNKQGLTQGAYICRLEWEGGSAQCRLLVRN